MLTHLTVPRLEAVERFFKTRSEKDLLGCYAWNQAVSAGLLPILSDFEVSFRNALHRALSQHFGQVDSFGWMVRRPNPDHASNQAAPALLPAAHKMSERAKEDIQTVTQKICRRKGGNYVVTPDDIVAALPFGFWEVLIGGLMHKSQPKGLQAAILANMFPNHPNAGVNDYGDDAFRKNITRLLGCIRDVRNRIGHHEQIWTIPQFDNQGVIGFFPRKPRHTIDSLHMFLERVCSVLSWIDPKIPIYIQSSDHWWSLHALLNREALATYRQLGGKIGTFQKILDASAPTQTNKTMKQKTRMQFIKRIAINSYFY